MNIWWFGYRHIHEQILVEKAREKEMVVLIRNMTSILYSFKLAQKKKKKRKKRGNTKSTEARHIYMYILSKYGSVKILPKMSNTELIFGMYIWNMSKRIARSVLNYELGWIFGVDGERGLVGVCVALSGGAGWNIWNLWNSVIAYQGTCEYYSNPAEHSWKSL